MGKNFFDVVRTNAVGLDRVAGPNRGLLFTNERHDDGVLKISRRKSPLWRVLKLDTRACECLREWDIE